MHKILKFIKNCSKFRRNGILSSTEFNETMSSFSKHCCFRLKSTQIINPKTNLKPVFVAGILSFFGFKEEEPESELIITIKRGVLLMQKEEYEKAEVMLHVALKLAQEQQNADGITYIYDLLANVAFDSGHYKKAEELFKTVLQRFLNSENSLPSDNKVIHISQKLALIYDNLGDKEKAELGYQYCLDHLERKISEEKDTTDDTLLLQMMTFWQYGHFLMSQNRPREACICLEKAVQVSLEKEGATDRTVSMLNDMGTALCMLGDFENAITHFQKAVDMGKQVPDARDLSVAWINLGDVYLSKKLLSEAKYACERGKWKAKENNQEEFQKAAEECLDRVKEMFL